MAPAGSQTRLQFAAASAVPVLADRHQSVWQGRQAPRAELVALDLAGQDWRARRAHQPPIRTSPPPVGGGGPQREALAAIMRLEFWAAQGFSALVAMDTHAGVQLYHVDLLDRSFLGGGETRFGGVAGRHVTAEPGKLDRGLYRSDRETGLAAFIAVCHSAEKSCFTSESPSPRGEDFLPRCAAEEQSLWVVVAETREGVTTPRNTVPADNPQVRTAITAPGEVPAPDNDR